MPPIKRNGTSSNIRTIADLNSIENDSPNVHSIPHQPTNIHNHFNYNGNSSSSDKGLAGVGEAVASTTTVRTTTPNIYHIPHLYNDTYAKQLLDRIVHEFLPIIQRRQYNIISISELCCCNDGLDFVVHNEFGDTKRRTKSRKIRKVADNIWGYNRTTFSNYNKYNKNNNNNKQHTIHIRLRHTNDHSKFLLYEDVAGTLAHELSHCIYGPHDNKFFKLMDEILEEHANLMYQQHLSTTTSTTTSLSSNTTTAGTTTRTTTPFSGTGQKLGSDVDRLGGILSIDGTPSSISNDGTGTGQILGGDRTFVQWMLPKDAAVIAAETRRRQQLLRLRGDHDCCRPCYDDDDNDDKDGYEIDIPNDTTYIADTNVGFRNNNINNEMDWNVTVNHVLDLGVAVHNVVDLTELLDDDDSDEYNVNIQIPWSCHICTYRNRPLSLVCDICSTTRQILRSK